ncbi:hypothetical protein I3842_01G109700 [Carya illinoinensis]|uniref:Neuroguidin n=1 Tax=Carya illinoinensis TaxID=32201 RepID=A0A922K358_CARIL|nr:hypothetical protein I3842_01G109700 [Carya illinoinensis]
MAGNTNSGHNDLIAKEPPQLTAVLKEMKEVLDSVRSKVEALTTKVKSNQFPTADGISYLEAKNLLLLNYCQSLVSYLLRKAKGFSIEGHPVVRSLVETRLFLEKIRPIDKKLQYQVQKLTRVAAGTAEADLLKYRPNPDMLVPKSDMTSEVSQDIKVTTGGVYRPPKFAPTSMEEGKISRHERNASRMEKQILRQSRQSDFVRGLMNDLEGRPEEVREIVGHESRELARYMAKMERRAQEEEQLFTRAPMTKMEKKKEKHLKKSRNA